MAKIECVSAEKSLAGAEETAPDAVAVAADVVAGGNMRSIENGKVPTTGRFATAAALTALQDASRGRCAVAETSLGDRGGDRAGAEVVCSTGCNGEEAVAWWLVLWYDVWRAEVSFAGSTNLGNYDRPET